MKTQELKQFSAEDLKSRIGQWREELFRSRFKAQSSEVRDTSVFRKLRRDIARAMTILNEKKNAPQDKAAGK
jgi:large subunit ribosomal protein L29